MPVGFPKMAVVPSRLQLVMWLLFMKGKLLKRPSLVCEEMTMATTMRLEPGATRRKRLRTRTGV